MEYKESCLCLNRSGLKRVKADGEIASVSTDSCYTEEFIERLNAHNFQGVSDYSNEVFLYYYVRMREFTELLKNNECFRFSFFAQLVDKSLFIRASSELGRNIRTSSRLLVDALSFFAFVCSVVAIPSLSLVLPCFLVRKKTRGSRLQLDPDREAVFLIRSDAAFRKCRVSIERSISAVTLVDNFGGLDVPGLSMYTVISRKNFLKISLKSFAYTIRDIRNFLEDGRVMLGDSCSYALISRYVSRIAHKAVYEACLLEVIRLSPRAVFYTGDKDDRFALLQTRLCRCEKKKLVCLPHGLEYGFRFPGGLAGTTFYCYTPEASSFLNKLYNEDKFVYEASVADAMFGEIKFLKQIERACFFTEPRDPEVNYQTIEELIQRGVNFVIKLHPLETASDYKHRFPNVDQIEDLDEAMRSSVCIARKSTILLEASRRGAKAIASLVNDKDRSYVMRIFPSLCSMNILRASTFDELEKLL
ncbi:hypothetical protein N9H49_04770 [Luminiphilus sp.]|nr:hypothetical protein [Luminiphilus sp.]